MYCQPRAGDEQIIIQVLKHRKTAEAWNDEDGRTKDEVQNALRAEITDRELEVVFGPQWHKVVRLVRRIATLSPEEAYDLATARTSVAAPMAEHSLGSAARAAARVGEWDAACFAVSRATDLAKPGTLLETTLGLVTQGTALALVVEDLVGDFGLRQEYLDNVTEPWCSVIGSEVFDN